MFGDLGLPPDLDGHLGLRGSAGMDLWFLPLGEDPVAHPGYRTFAPEELRGLGALSPPGLLGLVVDGPFGREIRLRGLEGALDPLVRSRAAAGAAFAASTRAAVDLVAATRGLGWAVVVADDLAGQTGPLVHPDALRAVLLPAYARLTEAIHGDGRLALLHSDGALTELVPDLRAAGFDGLAAYEPELVDARRALALGGASWRLIGGVPATWVLEGAPPRGARDPAAPGPEVWALASACGIADGACWRHLLECYQLL